MNRRIRSELFSNPQTHLLDPSHLIVLRRYDQVDNLHIDTLRLQGLERLQHGLEPPLGKISIVIVCEPFQVDTSSIEHLAKGLQRLLIDVSI